MSPEQDTSPAGRLQRGAERPARLVHTICQMILGLALAVALILKVYMAILTDHACAADSATLGNAIRCTPTLTLLAYLLALSAGFDLAYRLFGHHSERISAPILLGLGAATLSVLSGIQNGGVGWRDALVVVALVGCMAGLVWLRQVLSSGPMNK